MLCKRRLRHIPCALEETEMQLACEDSSEFYESKTNTSLRVGLKPGIKLRATNGMIASGLRLIWRLKHT